MTVYGTYRRVSPAIIDPVIIDPAIIEEDRRFSGLTRIVNSVSSRADIFVRRSQTIAEPLRLDVPNLKGCRFWERLAEKCRLSDH
jgi:hypothetical protein